MLVSAPGREPVYAFHSYRVDPARRLLLRDGRPIRLTTKVFDLLLFLIRSRDRVVSRQELLQRLWPDTTVEDGNLSVGISVLRKALEPQRSDPPVIETRPRFGYRFVAETHEHVAAAPAASASPPAASVAEASAAPAAASLHLPAKVSRPDTGDAIARERLFCALDERSARPLTWLHAPAGAGKTTLLTTYLCARGASVLWYDVDAGDADASSLFHYVRLAAQGVLGGAVELPVPRPASPEAARIFVRRFFEALFEQLPSGTCLVFDNYQEAAQHPTWNEMFRELCTVLTPRVRILVASRVAPPHSLSRFFVQDELALLSSQDLRLDEREVEHLLRRRADSRQGDGARLLALTGGWAVGVALLAKSRLTSSPAPGSLPGPPEDELQGIFDFVAGEIWDRLDAASRELLLQVALLPSFSAAMAVELTGRSDAAPVLTRLHRECLLVERHGHSGFRLHGLLRMFLLHRATLEQGGAAVGLLGPGARDGAALPVRAARLLAQNDQFPAAVELLTAEKNWPVLAELIEKHAPLLAAQGRVGTLGATLESLPSEHRDARPWLLYWRSVSLLGRAGGEAQALAEQAFHAFRASGEVAGILSSWALVMQAMVTAGDDLHPLERWRATLRELALVPPTPALAAKVALSEMIGHVYGSVPRSVEVADRAIAIVSQHGTPDERMLARSFATTLYLFADHAERAEEMQHIALEELSVGIPDPLAKIIYLHGQAVLELARGLPKQAARAARHGLALADESGIDAWNFYLFGQAALSAAGCRDFDTAERMSEAMTAGAARHNNFAHGYRAYVDAWIAFERMDLDTARRCNAQSLRLAVQVGFGVGRYCSATLQVLCDAAAGDAVALRRALAALDACLGPTPPPFHATAGDLARVYAGLCLGEQPRESLRIALVRARRSGYGVFLGARVVSRLASAALEYGIEVEHAHQLLHAYDLPPEPRCLMTRATPAPARSP